MKTFGEALRNLRRAKGVTQRNLAEAVGVDFSYISKLENNRVPPAAGDTIVRICEILGAPPDELLAATGKVPSDVKQVLTRSPAALQFALQATALRLTDEEWQQLSRQMKSLRSD